MKVKKRIVVSVTLAAISATLLTACGVAQENKVEPQTEQINTSTVALQTEQTEQQESEKVTETETETVSAITTEAETEQKTDIESAEDSELTLDEVFSRFEGQWDLDDQGSISCIEKAEDSPYKDGENVKGAKWLFYQSGGDMLCDLDVIDYGKDYILFMRHNDTYNFDSYYLIVWDYEDDYVETYYDSSFDMIKLKIPQ